MKVLWFEVTRPAGYNGKSVRGGWQDSLESIIREQKDIELIIAFEASKENIIKRIGSVIYEPMDIRYNKFQNIANLFTYKYQIAKIENDTIRVVKKYQPDIIHVFGTEWPFGVIAKHTNIPVIIHIQGSIIAYNNADYPPHYSLFSQLKANNFHPKTIFHSLSCVYRNRSREKMEGRIWKAVNYYIGRTEWDKSIVKTINHSANYYHVEEAIRPIFLESKQTWRPHLTGSNVRLFTIGVELRKGLDVILKTAKILKANNIDFEWIVAGKIYNRLLKIVESIQKERFTDNNVKFTGELKPENLIDYFTTSTLYVHTAYAENSPNSICEAQLLGVPVISTMVGGISTLIRNDVDGELVPANDPWQLAYKIMTLSKNLNKLTRYSKNGLECSRRRHDPNRILSQLLNCYQDVLINEGNEKFKD